MLIQRSLFCSISFSRASSRMAADSLARSSFIRFQPSFPTCSRRFFSIIPQSLPFPTPTPPFASFAATGKESKQPVAALLQGGSVKISKDDVVREDDPASNVPDAIFSKLGMQLHRRDNHPIGILKNAIYDYFDANYSGKFMKFDDLSPIVSVKAASGINGAVIITTLQQVSLIDVRKEISFCKKVGIRVLGVVENMSGLRQPLLDLKFQRLVAGEKGTAVEDVTEWAHKRIKENAPELLSVFACCEVFDISLGGAAKMCADMGIPFLGKVLMDPQLGREAEEGRSCFEDQKCSSNAPALLRIVEQLIAAHE